MAQARATIWPGLAHVFHVHWAAALKFGRALWGQVAILLFTDDAALAEELSGTVHTVRSANHPYR